MDTDTAALADILVVDDQLQNLKMLTTLLSGRGYHVRPAMSGELALKAIGKKMPDIILLDILMPDMNGYQVCAKIKENPLTSDIPILFLSALTNTEDKLRAFRSGGADYIIKPFQVEEVLARVHTHLNLAKMSRDREHLVHDLNERIKELKCLNRITDEIYNLPLSSEMFQQVCSLVPLGWQHPEHSLCRVVYRDQEYSLSTIAPHHTWRQSAKLEIRGEQRGYIEVVYAADSALNPFIEEEQTLLNNIARVISENIGRKETEKRLSKSEFRYRALFEHMNSGVIVCLPQDNGNDFVFHDLNRAAEFILQHSRERLLGRCLSETFPVMRTNGMLNVFLRAWSADNPEHIPAIRFQDGHLDLWMEARVYRLPDGELVVVFDDVTHRKHAEELMREAREQLEVRVTERTRELQQANLQLRELAKLKDEFLASMSHELRSPLNAILGGTEIMQEEIYGPLTDDQNRTLNTIHDSAKHLLSLISDILDVAKVGAGKLELQISDVSPQEICISCTHLIKEMAQKKRLKVATRFDPQVDIIQADARRLKQILLNLLSNAVKFTPERGSVGLGFQGDRSKGLVTFEVWDSGIGIEESMFERLFEPFIQVDSSLARHYEGTGLGLALVKSLTDLHGGSVSLSSTLNEGSRFCVTLPWIMYAETPQECYQDNASSTIPELCNISIGAHIVLVEDNEHTRNMLKQYLKCRGYNISVAADGAEAIQILRNVTPRLVLMDIQMPGINGLEVIRRIRNDITPAASVPIIALTALAMQGDKERCLAAGADAYLSKPVIIRDLIEMIETLLSAAKNS
jgi:PAS domain S-box-containing protein